MSLDLSLRDPSIAGANLSIRLYTSSGPVVAIDPVPFTLSIARQVIVFDAERAFSLSISRQPFDLARAQEGS